MVKLGKCTFFYFVSSVINTAFSFKMFQQLHFRENVHCFVQLQRSSSSFAGVIIEGHFRAAADLRQQGRPEAWRSERRYCQIGWQTNKPTHCGRARRHTHTQTQTRTHTVLPCGTAGWFIMLSHSNKRSEPRGAQCQSQTKWILCS